MNMQKTLGFFLVALLLATGGVRAQRGQQQRAGERAEEMRERLQFTEEQEQQMRPILKDTGKQVRELRERYRNEERNRETAQAMRKEMEAIQASTRAQLEQILSSEQLAEYDALQSEWREQRHKGRGEQGPPKN
jgi:hypothetical protein